MKSVKCPPFLCDELGKLKLFSFLPIWVFIVFKDATNKGG